MVPEVFTNATDPYPTDPVVTTVKSDDASEELLKSPSKTMVNTTEDPFVANEAGE